MSSQIIPKERLSAYQRWELDAFEEPAAQPSMADDPDENRQGEDKSETKVVLPTVEQVERIYQQAQQDGYAAGYETGLVAGHEAGLRAGKEEAAAEAARLQELLHGFGRELVSANQTVSNDLLTLALCLAKEMVREALKVKPELIFAVVRECLHYDNMFNSPIQLFLHPDDADLVRKHLNHEINDCTVHVDSKLERGGCRIKMGSSQMDATLATRWQRIAQALGQNSRWLD
jgi:flagellar assembly protein FliH